MKKILAIAALVTAFGFQSKAQQNASSSAQQSVKLDLSNALEITFVNSGTSTGNTVIMAFTTPDQFANGVESTEQELKIRSNKSFKVGVKIDYNSFGYSGNLSSLNYNDIPMYGFGLKVTNNNTGGTIATPFSTGSFTPLVGTDQDVILNGNNGGDQRFAVKYKATPGFNLPSGTYSFDVIYTATQQ